MKKHKIVLWSEGEYQYQGAYGFIPFMMTYIHEDTQVRPCMIVVPGGGYCMVSPTEGELVALKFYEKGYNAFVCTYTTKLLQSAPLGKEPMNDLSRMIRMIRKNALEYKTDAEKVVVCGFSAGAHLCGSICVHHMDITDISEEYADISNCPNAAILSYPVISANTDTIHLGSFEALYGKEISKEDLEYASLERHVTENTPPCFIWQTATDETVPVANSYLFAQACQKHHVPYAHHVFSEGKHGLSLADEDWANGRYGVPYTLEQVQCIVRFMNENNITIPDEMRGVMRMLNVRQFEELPEDAQESQKSMKANEEVRIWPELAHTWLKKFIGLSS